MENSKFIWKTENNQLRLFFRIDDKNNYHCNPYKSNLIASIFNGLEILPFSKDKKIILFEQNIDIQTKKIFVDFFKAELFGIKQIVDSDFKNNSEKNINILYLNIQNQSDCQSFKDNFFYILKLKCFVFININKKINTEIQNIINPKVNKNIKLIQEVNIDNFFKDQYFLLFQIN